VRRILLISDNRVLGFTLALLGHEVRLLSDRRGAVEVARSYRPHLIMLDATQTPGDGYPLGRRLRQQLGHEVCLLTVSNNAHEEDLLAGYDAILARPVSAEKVLALLAAWTNREAVDSV
jgi:two-component system OmpR family response regulator